MRDTELGSVYRDAFHHIKDLKIAVYGTGKKAGSCVDGLEGFSIAGVIDRARFTGEFHGYPMILWDEVERGTIDVIIIAAALAHVPAIYDRIYDRCMAYGIQIYNSDGTNLLQYYGAPRSYVAHNPCLSFCEEDLRREIDRHDGISFDVFDTLVMRKALEPADVFDLVEYRVKKKGIVLHDFKKYRREAELLAGNADIYRIYEILSRLLGLGQEECQRILDEELHTEEECLIPRERMVGWMDYAVGAGKKVSLISDMYLPKDIMERLLMGMGIHGYGKLFISCDYGCGKEEGLFDIYKDAVRAESYLHIGDNGEADGICAARSGIDVFPVLSAYDMLKASSLRQAAAYANNCNEKGFLGLAVAELFNDPFALYGTDGTVQMDSPQRLGKVLVAPAALLYLQNLEAALQEKEYEGVLFAARDGYLFQMLYEMMRDSGKSAVFGQVPAYYIAASRKLCIRAAMKDEESISMIKGVNTEGFGGARVLTDLFNIPKDQLCEMRPGEGETEYYLRNKDAILSISGRVRENYRNYLESMGIRMDKRYLFCDLNSTGTSHYGLSNLFEAPLDGAYLLRYHAENTYSHEVRACYEIDELAAPPNSFMQKTNLLEVVLSAPAPSIIDIGDDGRPVYAEEKRTAEEIGFMEQAQKGILSISEDYLRNMYIPGHAIKREYAERIFCMCGNVAYSAGCGGIENSCIYDDFMGLSRGLF